MSRPHTTRTVLTPPCAGYSVPNGNKAIGSRWVDKKKADIVVLVWERLAGVDCNQTFAPVCRIQGISKIPAIATESNRERWQLGYNTTFVHAAPKNKTYVSKMAPGCRESDRAINSGGRAPGRSTPHGGGRFLLERNAQGGVWYALRPRFRLYRQRVNSSRPRETDLQLAGQERSSMMLRDPGSGQAGED